MYPNWELIVALGRRDPHLMRVLANATSDHYGERLQKAFPEFFRMEETKRVPLTKLQQMARKRVKSATGGEQLLTLNAVTFYRIPTLGVALNEATAKKWCESLVLLPPEVPADSAFGSTVHWSGIDWLVVEREVGRDVLHIVPLACIDPLD